MREPLCEQSRVPYHVNGCPCPLECHLLFCSLVVCGWEAMYCRWTLGARIRNNPRHVSRVTQLLKVLGKESVSKKSVGREGASTHRVPASRALRALACC